MFEYLNCAGGLPGQPPYQPPGGGNPYYPPGGNPPPYYPPGGGNPYYPPGGNPPPYYPPGGGNPYYPPVSVTAVKLHKNHVAHAVAHCAMRRRPLHTLRFTSCAAALALLLGGALSLKLHYNSLRKSGCSSSDHHCVLLPVTCQLLQPCGGWNQPPCQPACGGYNQPPCCGGYNQPPCNVRSRRLYIMI